MDASVDVVIPVYNHYELTRECLRHLSRQTIAHRAIVVDDGSGDDTPERIRADWPAVELVQLAANRGYTAAVNRGVQAGGGEYVVLLNNDVQVRPDFLQRLIEPMQADASVGSVASLMLATDEWTIDSFGVTADATLAGFARLQAHPASAALASGSATDGAEAAAPAAPTLTGPEGTAGAYRRRAWEQVGGLDETIVAYMEILDLALRLRAAGWSAAAAPEAAGVHLGSATYGRRSPAQRRLAGFSRGYLLRRYGVLRGRVAPRALLTEGVVVALDLLACRDLAALQGRLSGWRAARSCPPHAPPPAEAIDASIGLWRSLLLRRSALRPTAGS